MGKVSQDPASFPWELYDLRNDWTQSENVAAKHPEKLKELEKIFWEEAKKYQVLPLDASVATRLVIPRPSHHRRPQRLHLDAAADRHAERRRAFILDASYNFKAEVDIPQDGGNGMLITQGGRFAGYGFYLLKGKPVFTWNLVDLKRHPLGRSTMTLSPGKHTLEFDFNYDGLGIGTLAFNNISGIGRSGIGVFEGRRQGRSRAKDGAHDPSDFAVGRVAGYRLGHADRRQRP